MADPVGYFNVGGSTTTLGASVTWTRLDSSYKLTEFSIDRGRSYEFDKTATGTANVRFVDTSGDLDPTNTGSTLYGKVDVLKQAVICMPNPVGATVTWSPVYRGFISAINVEVDPTERIFYVDYELVDALDILAATELVPSTTTTPIFGNTVTASQTGDVYYAGSTVPYAVQTRINQVLDEVGWPSGMRQIFSGNSKLQAVTYPYRTSALSVIQDAADAEFPGVSNFYVNAGGTVVFHGRYARFDPTTVATSTSWDFTDWKVGDLAAATSNPATVVPLLPPLRFARDKENLYTSAIATPQTGTAFTDSDIASQYVTSTAGVSAYGLRTWSAENLLNAGGQVAISGASTFTAIQVTHAMANYYATNYSTPKTRLPQITIGPQPPTGIYGTATWQMITGVDISDRVTVTTSHTGGGGFSGATFFVEGVHYHALPMTASYPNVTLTLDLSPASYYSTFPVT